MSELTVATRYAKALIDLAEENKSLEETRKDMELFRNIKGQSRAPGGVEQPDHCSFQKIKYLEAIFG